MDRLCDFESTGSLTNSSDKDSSGWSVAISSNQKLQISPVSDESGFVAFDIVGLCRIDAFAAQMTQITEPKILEHKTSSSRSDLITPVPHHDPAKLLTTIESS